MFKIRSLKHLQQLIGFLPFRDAQIDETAGIRLSKTGSGTPAVVDTTNTPYTVQDSDFLIELNSAGGNVQADVPKPNRNRWLIFKKTHGSNNGTIASTENIDGVPSRILQKINEYLVMYWNGTTWRIGASGQEQGPVGSAGGVLSGTYPSPKHVGGGTLPPTPIFINSDDLVPTGYSAVAVQEFEVGPGAFFEVQAGAYFAIL